MPTFLLIGIPIIVAVLLFGILSLPDEEVKEDKEEPEKATSTVTKKSSKKKKK